MSLLGIDVGTTGCKSAAFSVDSGKLIASAYSEYPVHRPRPDRAELDSREVFSKIKECITQVLSKTKKDPVTAICISSMGEAMTPVSAKREILGNSILMTDIRGAEYIRKLKIEIGQNKFYEINPNILGTNYSLPKLMWLMKHEPALYKKAWKFLLWGDLVAFMLGAEPLTSYSLANRTLLFDIHKENWSDFLLEWSGFDRNKLPECVPSGSIAGTVSDEISKELGLPAGVKIVVGGHDQCCNSLGAGINIPHKAICGIGTFECITPTYKNMPQVSRMLKAGLNIEHHVVKDLYVSFIYNQSGSLIRWFRDTFASADKKLLAGKTDIYDILASEMPEEPTQLLVLPHFEMTGTPDFISDSSGVIAGLKISTTRGEILKAIMEGATFYFVESINQLKEMGIDTSEFIATGGGAKSNHWLQIKADIFGVPFVRPRVTECGLLGAAILAGFATGELSGIEQGISTFVKHDRVFEPDLSRHRIYQEQYAKYRQLYPSMKKLLLKI